MHLLLELQVITIILSRLDLVYLFSVPEVIDGNTLTATVVDLNAWVEYEFRVLARNSVGVGEPSPASLKTRTEDAGESQHSTGKMICYSMIQ